MRATLLLALAACGGGSTVQHATAPKPPAPPPAPALPAPPPAPGLRLGDAVVPTRYALDLTIVPAAATFDGSVDIDVDLARPTTGVWLNASELQIHSATVDGAPARVLASPKGDDQHLGLGTDRVVGPGRARLHITFTGTFQPRETQGVFKQESGGDPDIFTQFEETDARRGFPCFDEPSFKTPWVVTLHVPAGEVAASNTPIAAETPEAKGMRAVRFAETRPLPSYLVAFTVGPFDVVDGGRSKGGAPIRILAPRGRGAEAAYAAASTKPILDILEDYFGTPYPFAKLDEVAIPKTVAFGAMENAGLVTYVETALLARAEDDTIFRRRRFAETAAHELAHMWFGDLVTLAWWNDTWLNESFATWMEKKVLERWQPGWEADVSAVAERSRALFADSLTTTRAIRQPIESENDIVGAFNPGITYAKGASLLRMFEAWIGPETFQKGVRAYLAAHAYKNARAQDFFAAVSAVAGRDVAPVMSSFLDQPGAPVVEASLACAPGARPRLELAQRRNILPGEHADELQWQIPVCARWDGGRACTLMTGPRATLELDARTCPAWVYPNAGGVGYYRSAPDARLLAALVKNDGRLEARERVALLGDLAGLVDAARVSAGQVLADLPALAPASSWHLAAAASSLLRTVRMDLVPAALEPSFARLVERLFGARARALGFLPRPGEGEDAEELRAIVVPLVALEGNDARLLAEARRLADRWLADHHAIPAAAAGDVLVIAAAHGDRPFFDRLLAEARRTHDRADRMLLAAALGSFQDPALQRAGLDVLYLSKDFDIREAGAAFRRFRTSVRHPERILDWAEARWADLAARMPRRGQAFLLYFGAGLCDEHALEGYTAFFKDRAQGLLGGPRIYDNVVEDMQSCIALKKLQSASVADFLRNRS